MEEEGFLAGKCILFFKERLLCTVTLLCGFAFPFSSFMLFT